MSKEASATRNVQERRSYSLKKEDSFEAVFHRLTDLLRNYLPNLCVRVALFKVEPSLQKGNSLSAKIFDKLNIVFWIDF